MMAFNQNYRPASQSSVVGMCSSHSYLDGVPFKISAAFKSQAQPTLPPELLSAKRCEAHNEEYTFDTEEAVLAWSVARAEAKAKVEAERRATERAKAALAAAGSSSSDSEDNAAEVNEEWAGNAVKTSGPGVQPVRPPWQLPVAASLSSDILTPTPIQMSQKKVQSPMAPKAAVDLALFEKEDDPFDNMELQTLNDMEELRTVLGGAVDGGSHGPSPNPDCQTLTATGEGEVATTVAATSGQGSDHLKNTVSSANNIFNSIPGVKMMDSKPSDSLSSSAVASHTANRTDCPSSSPVGSASEPTSDDDYVKIRTDYSQHTVHFQRDSGLANSEPRSNGVLGGELPLPYANSKAFKPVLPPIRPRGKSLGEEGAINDTVGGLVSSMAAPTIPPSHSGRSFMGSGMSQSAYVMSTSASSAVDMSVSDTSLTDRHRVYRNVSGSQSSVPGVASSAAFSNNVYSRYGNVGSGSPLPMNDGGVDRGRLRSAQSNPDFLARSSSPYGDRPPSSSQLWNPYQPLPPTPVPDLRSASSSPGLPPEQNHRSPSPQLTSSNTAGTPQLEYDPYPKLSSEAKTFVNNLTSMGFSRSRVSRAVEKFGPDEREVVDHLLNVDKLVEKKFTPALVETSLQLFQNNMTKAELFLGLYQQFTELGFTGERIQVALVKHELDRDRALDYLTT